MNKYRQTVIGCTGAAMLLGAVFTTGCTSTDHTHTQEGAATGAALGAILGGIIGHQSGETNAGIALGAVAGALAGGAAGNSKDKEVAEIKYENQVATETAAREKADAEAKRQHDIAVGKSLNDSEIIAASLRAAAAEAEVARLKAEENAAINKAKQLEDYQAREAAANAEAERLRSGK